jgi:endonuclease YncB( thermonuclease family)
MLTVFAASIVAAGASFSCTPTRVWDGDGPIWCAEGPKIRLAGIAAREIGGECKRGHPCPAAAGPAAREALVKLLGKPIGSSREGHVLVKAEPLRCLSDGSGKGDRTAAWCWAGKVQVNCAMVRGGWALRWAQYDRHGRLCG